MIGIHGGYQRQYGNRVLGIEAAFSAGDHGRKSSSCSFPVPFDDRCDVTKLNLYTTAGLKYGYITNDRWLVFATGGYAYSRVDTQIRFGGVGVPPPDNAVPVTRTRAGIHGPYAGMGIEYAMTNNWLLALEYQHVFFMDSSACVGGNCRAQSILNRDVSADLDVIRFRISYKN